VHCQRPATRDGRSRSEGRGAGSDPTTPEAAAEHAGSSLLSTVTVVVVRQKRELGKSTTRRETFEPAIEQSAGPIRP
jgi:hypothetical protein